VVATPCDAPSVSGQAIEHCLRRRRQEKEREDKKKKFEEQKQQHVSGALCSMLGSIICPMARAEP